MKESSMCNLALVSMLFLSCSGNQGTTQPQAQPEVVAQRETQAALVGDLSNVPQDILNERGDMPPGEYLYRSGSLFLYTDENGAFIQTPHPETAAVHIGFL